MSAAHLRAVPDPEPDPEPDPDETPDPWKWPAPVPAVAVPRHPVDDDPLENPPTDEDQEETADREDAGEEHQKEDAEDEAEPRGWMPDLRPYCDPRPLAELGPLAVEAGKKGGPPLLRAIWAGLTVLGRGTGVLLVLLAGYLSGALGRRGSVGARLAGAGFLGYCVVKLSLRYPYTPWLVLAALTTAVILAGLGHIQAPGSKSAKKETEKGTAKKKTDGEQAAPTSPEGKPATPGKSPEATPQVSKEEFAEAPRASWATRLFHRPATTAEQPAGDGGEESGEADDGEADGDDAQAPAETAADPSREDVIRSLHHLYRGGSGALHTALAAHLQLPSTKAVKRVLDEARIPYRSGVRTPAGNGPGVHRDDIPPLPPAQKGGQGAEKFAGQGANANANNAANAAEEGFGAYRTEWTREELQRGFRSVPDPEGGPAASKIEYR